MVRSRTPAVTQPLQSDARSARSRVQTFGISAKITRVSPRSDSDPGSATSTSADNLRPAQSEQLAVAEQPLDHPLYGAVLDLEALRPDLVGAHGVAITGKSQKTQRQPPPSHDSQFRPDDGTGSRSNSNPGDSSLSPIPRHCPSTPTARSPTGWLDHRSRKRRVSDWPAGHACSAASSDLSLLTRALQQARPRHSGIRPRLFRPGRRHDPFPHTQILLTVAADATATTAP